MSESRKKENLIMNYDCIEMNQCVPQETVIRGVRLAEAYVPFQKMCTLFNPIDALKNGTAFPELYSPYAGKSKVVKCSSQC